MGQASRPLAVVTGASSGIGLELARLACANGYDVLLADRDESVSTIADDLRGNGCGVVSVVADLSTTKGVDQLDEAIGEMGRPVELLFANAGRGLGNAFLDQSIEQVFDVIDTNVRGTVYLLHCLASDMRARGAGRILVTGSVAGYIPGTYRAVYNGTKAFIDSFTNALRNELADSGVSVTCLMPGATETQFFKTAGMMDTKIGTEKKDSPAEVAKLGWDALMRGDASVICGLMNKAQVMASKLMPQDMAARAHAREAGPGTARRP